MTTGVGQDGTRELAEILETAEARTLMGDDYWPYGVEPNRKALENFLKHHHAQGLSSRPLRVEEMFHKATLESFKI